MIILLILLWLPPPEPIAITPLPSTTSARIEARLPRAIAQKIPRGKLSQEQGEQWLTFSLIDPVTKRPGPAILGRYHCKGNVLHFEPRFSLTPGQKYLAQLNGIQAPLSSRLYIVPHRKKGPATRVTHIYPTAKLLPANQLKFYIHFSQPMLGGKAVFNHIHLIDQYGKEVHQPWRRTELWTNDFKRLTLWIHPGRVKRGVNLREDLGPVLKPHQQYQLVIDQKLLDGNGNPLARPFRHTFKTKQADRSRPLPQRWTIKAPLAQTRAPLTVQFGEPLDSALLQRFLEVIDKNGRICPGAIQIGEEESTWHFEPRHPWKAEEYFLRAHPRLEDLAGNTPERLFDLDLKAPPGAKPRLLRSISPQPKAIQQDKP